MLNATLLNMKLSSFMDPDSPFFTEFPENEFDISDSWGDAMNSYLQNIIPPSTTLSSAIQLFKLQVIGIMNEGMFETVLSTSLLSLAGTLAVGMAPSFVGTPPPIPIILTPVIILGFNSKIHTPIISLLTTTIDLWFRTGLATNPVSGTVIPWN